MAAIPVSFSIEVDARFGRWSMSVKLADRTVYWAHFNETVQTEAQAEKAAIDAFAERLESLLREDW